MISTVDGKPVEAVKLESIPVFDGLVAANKGLYMSRVDGKITCFR